VIDSAGIARVLRCRCAGWIVHGKAGSLFRFLDEGNAEEVFVDFFFGTVHNNALRLSKGGGTGENSTFLSVG